MDANFRMRQWYRNLGIAVVLEFLALGTLGVYEALTEPGVKHRAVAAAMIGGIALVMPGLSFWMLVSYRRHELTVRGDRVTLRGIMQRREIDLREVTEARWVPRPVGGSLVLRSGSTRIPIHFANYESEERPGSSTTCNPCYRLWSSPAGTSSRTRSYPASGDPCARSPGRTRS